MLLKMSDVGEGDDEEDYPLCRHADDVFVKLVLPKYTVIGKTFNTEGSSWLYWKGEETIESKLFDSQKELNLFVEKNQLSTELCFLDIYPTESMSNGGKLF